MAKLGEKRELKQRLSNGETSIDDQWIAIVAKVRATLAQTEANIPLIFSAGNS